MELIPTGGGTPPSDEDLATLLARAGVSPIPSDSMISNTPVGSTIPTAPTTSAITNTPVGSTLKAPAWLPSASDIKSAWNSLAPGLPPPSPDGAPPPSDADIVQRSAAWDVPVPAINPEDIPKFKADMLGTRAGQDTILGKFRATDPDYENDNDIVLARKLYNDPESHKPEETFPAFADRIGVKTGGVETFAAQGMTKGFIGLPTLAETAISGYSGGRPAMQQKFQEIQDATDVRNYQHPLASFGGDAAGTLLAMRLFGGKGGFLEGTSQKIPGFGWLQKRGALGDVSAKLGTMGGVEQIPPEIARMLADGTMSWEQVQSALGRIAGGTAEGTVAGFGGGILAKILSAFGGPLVESTGKSMQDMDKALQGIPRSQGTKGVVKLSSGYTGELGKSPAELALQGDRAYYERLLDNSGLDVPKAVDQLSGLMKEPGAAYRIANAAEASPQWKTLKQPSLNGVPPIGADEAEQLLNDLATGQNVNRTSASLNRAIELMNNRDPTGRTAQMFVADIYKSIIPDRLAGPFDPGFQGARNPNAVGTLGRLIQPPLRGPGYLGQQVYERTGGAPGSMMRFNPMGPRSMAGTNASTLLNIPSLGARAVGKGLEWTGRGITALGSPAGPNMPNMVQTGAQAGMGLLGKPIPETYMPSVPWPTPPPQKSPDDPSKHAWIGSLPQDQQMALVSERLGPDVAAKLQAEATSPEQYKAAMFNLMSDPNYRMRLTG